MPQSQDSAKTIFPTSRKLFLRLLAASCLVSLGFITVLGLNADWDTVFSELDAKWLAAAVAGMTALQFLSGYRLYRFLPAHRREIASPVLRSVKVMFLFQALLKMLPFRLGEAGFFWLSGRYLSLSFRDALGVFLGFRIWDLRVVALSFLLCGGMLLKDTVPWGQTVFLIVAAFGIAMFMLSTIRVIRLAQFVFRAVHRLTSFRWAEHTADSLAESALTLTEGRSVRNSLSNGAISLLTWGSFFVIFHCLYLSVGVDLTGTATVMVVSGMILVGVIPIQTLGGIGLLEFGQASLLVLAGLSATEAAGKSLAVGGLFLGLCLVIPAVLFLLFSACGWAKRAEEP